MPTDKKIIDDALDPVYRSHDHKTDLPTTADLIDDTLQLVRFTLSEAHQDGRTVAQLVCDADFNTNVAINWLLKDSKDV